MHIERLTKHYEITAIGTDEFYAKPTDEQRCGRRFAFRLIPDQTKIKIGARFTEKYYREKISDIESRWWCEYEFEDN